MWFAVEVEGVVAAADVNALPGLGNLVGFPNPGNWLTKRACHQL